MSVKIEQSVKLPDKYKDFFLSGQPKDHIHYMRASNTVIALIEMVVLHPDGQFEKTEQPITARLQKKFLGQLLYRKPIQKPDDVKSIDHEEKRIYPNIDHPGPFYVIGITPPMYRRPNHGWGDLQEAIIVAEQTIRGVSIMVLPTKHVSPETYRQAIKDLKVNTVHPAYLSGLQRRLFWGYSNRIPAPHDLHL